MGNHAVIPVVSCLPFFSSAAASLYRCVIAVVFVGFKLQNMKDGVMKNKVIGGLEGVKES